MHRPASPEPPAPASPLPTRRSRPWLLSLLVILIVLASVVATVAIWVTTDVASPDNFVAVVAPAGRDPRVQAAIGSEIQAMIEQRLATDPAASGARRAASDLLRRRVQQAIQDLLASDRFTVLWDSTVRETQAAYRYLFEQGGQSPLTVTSGQISVNLGPFIAEVRAFMEAQGIEVPADRLPPGDDYHVVIVESDELRQAQQVLSLTNLLAIVLPAAALILLVVACLVAAPWPRAVLWTGVGIVAAMALLALITLWGQSTFQDSTVDDTSGIIADAVAAAIADSFRTDLAIVAALGIGAIVIGVIANRGRPGTA